ncbi:MAG: Flp family type IVb pilin [Candidatus Sericytochromatia bacterium]|nr:Flp family type IVb pilin [Candidatus Sericytochromatia bacterium]
MLNNLKTLVRDEDGQGMVEYGLIVGIISVAAIVSLTSVRGKLAQLFTAVTEGLGKAEGNIGAT